MKVGLLSDTHGFLDERILGYFEECDEIWHAGDIGSMEIANQLSSFKKLQACYGNIDNLEVREKYPAEQIFEINGIKVFMTHIGGYPPIYSPQIIKRLDNTRPQLFICGHSHIVKIMHDPKRELLHINPGAAGKQGFHKIRTIVRFRILAGKIEQVQLIELGKRA
jgi:putative phosphoesterase